MFAMMDKEKKAKMEQLDELIKMCEDDIAAPGKSKRAKTMAIVVEPKEEEDSSEEVLEVSGDEKSVAKDAIDGLLDDMSDEELEEMYERIKGNAER